MTDHNHLAGESSPYLLQHAKNPVHWYPWSAQALQRAREQDKPILLSVGYSACHWCHVMAHESFEDPATAEVMNRLFVNIKVDREERPDLDKIYQSAYQLLNQRAGGWPLNVFLTPDDHTPFFAGTYFPPAPRHGMPAFRDILQSIADFYQQQRDEIREQRTQIIAALESLNPAGGDTATLEEMPLDQARQQLASHYDSTWGGFGQAPKFPHPTNLERLLRHWAATRNHPRPDEPAREMALSTLHAMASGGIYDQLGGGFFRYSVDERWMIPHFEKMLYDNGPLLCLYSEAWQASGQPTFKRIAEETAAWVMREMQSPQGGYYSTLDADSEGGEGRFYVWTRAELQAVLEPGETTLCAAVYGLNEEANFEGRWHLRVCEDSGNAGERMGLSASTATAMLQGARQKLYHARQTRIKPGRDEKILTAWNALMIKGMAAAGRRLAREDFIASAQHAVDFIHQELWQSGRLLATYKDGQARIAAYLDDYAYLADALLELLQASWRSQDLQFAVALCEALLQHFQDPQAGGFYFTADDHETLIHRPKPAMDDAMPAGNGIAAQVLLRLGHLLGEPRYLDAAAQTLASLQQAFNQHPYAHCALLNVLEEYLQAGEIILLRGEDVAMADWQRAAAKHYAPTRMVFAIPGSASDLPEALAACAPWSGQAVVAYPCGATGCLPALTHLKDFEAHLQAHA